MSMHEDTNKSGTAMTEVHERNEDSHKTLNDAPVSDIEVLRRPQYRTKTDKTFLFVFAACVVLLVPFLIYTLYHSDINRLIIGYDGCGNICGQENVKYDQWNCTGQDMFLKPIFFSGECKGAELPWFREFDPLSKIVHNVWKLALVSLVPLVLCLILLTLFRYVPSVAVWCILIFPWLLLSVLPHWLGLVGNDKMTVIATIIWLMVFCSWVLIFHNKAKLVSLMLQEATKAVFAVKKIILISTGTLSILIIVLLTYAITTIYTTTAGKLTELGIGYLDYATDNIMVSTIILTTIIFFWAIEFVFGTLYMSLSLAVAQWYTTKNQNNTNDAVLSNLRLTVNYHLGTIALGSIMTIIMFIPRLAFQLVTMYSTQSEKADSWLGCLDNYFTRKVYIITATHGTSFFHSGRKVAQLLKFSIGSTRDINSSGNFVIVMGQTLVVFISVIAVYSTTGNHICGLIEIGIAYCCTQAILGTLKISSNTLFFCTAEVLLRNKEDDLPYTMTMKELLDSSNKLFIQRLRGKPISYMPGKVHRAIIFLFSILSVVSTCIFIAAFVYSGVFHFLLRHYRN